MRSALGAMLAVMTIEERAGFRGVSGLSARFMRYVDGLRKDGIVVARPQGFFPPEWIFPRIDLPSEDKLKKIEKKLSDLGIEL